MKNFYFGFKGNVFSKMFMMVAVFMAMSSSLYGGVPTFTAETIDDGNDGDIDYIKITITSNGTAESGNYKISYASTAELNAKFEVLGLKDPVTFARADAPNVIGVYTDNKGTTALGSSPVTLSSGTSIYLKLDGSHPLDTGAKPQIFYDADEDSGLTAAIYNADNSNNIMPRNSKVASDGALPLLTSVVATSMNAGDDTVVLTFSEKVKYKVDESGTLGKITIRDGITDTSDRTLTGVSIVETSDLVAAGTGSKTVTLKITDGIVPGNYISKEQIKAYIGANAFKDLANQDFAAKDKVSNTPIGLEEVKPKVDTTGSIVKLNGTAPKIVLIVNEKLKNATGIKIGVKNVTTGINFPLTGTPDYTISNNTLTLLLANYPLEVTELRKLLGDKANVHSDTIKVGIIDNGSATDVLSNDLSDADSDLVSVATYLRDDSPPAIHNVVYGFNNKIKINFTDAINQTHGDIVKYLDIKYKDGYTAPIISSSSKPTDKQVEIIFTAALRVDKTIQVKTATTYTATGSHMIKNYTGLVLAQIGTAKEVVIDAPPAAPTYEDFTLDMGTGKMVVDFGGLSGTNEMTITTFDPGDIKIVNGAKSLLLSNDTNASITGSGKKMTIALSGSDLEKLKVLIEEKKTNITLDIAAISSLVNNYNTGVAAKTGITLSANITQDESKPTVSHWTLNLDDKKLTIAFNTPIAYTGTIDKYFSITKDGLGTLGLSGDVTIGSFNAIDIGTNNGDTKVDFNQTVGDNNKTLIFTLSDSFINEILDDTALATSKENAYLTIRSNNIMNISEHTDSHIEITATTNLPRKLDTITKVNGNVNIIFTQADGVNLVGNTSAKTDALIPNYWYHRAIPNGIELTDKNLLDAGFSTDLWKYDGGWKEAGNLLRGKDHKGYWFKTSNSASTTTPNRVLATYKSGDEETKADLIARIKRAGASYTLIGITNDLTASEVNSIKATTGKRYFIHHYDIDTADTNKKGKWDIRDDLKEGEAIWVRSKSL